MSLDNIWHPPSYEADHFIISSFLPGLVHFGVRDEVGNHWSLLCESIQRGGTSAMVD